MGNPLLSPEAHNTLNAATVADQRLTQSFGCDISFVEMPHVRYTLCYRQTIHRSVMTGLFWTMEL
jgi:hypothetical protein